MTRTKDESEKKIRDEGIKWLNNRLDILSKDTLDKIKSVIDDAGDPRTGSPREYTSDEKTILNYWVELNKQRYINTSHHIHFTLDKVHDSFKIFMQLFVALAALTVAVFSGKFGTWVMSDQIIGAKHAMFILIIAMLISFSTYLFFWARKWGQFRNLEYNVFGGFLKNYDKNDADYGYIYPIILVFIITICCGAMLLGLDRLVDESKHEDVEGVKCLQRYYECLPDSNRKCREELKACLIKEVSEFNTEISVSTVRTKAD